MAASVKNLNDKIQEIMVKTINPLREEGHSNWTAEQVSEFRKANDALTALYDERKQAEEVEAALAELDEVDAKRMRDAADQMTHPGNQSEGKADNAPRSIGEYFTNSDAFKLYDATHNQGPTVELPIGDMLAKGFDFKTLMDTTDWPSRDMRLPGFVDYPRVRLTIADLIPQGSTNSASISYVSESAGTNAADTVAEGVAKPESALTFTEVTAAVKKIATWIPVTSELMEDEPALRSIIDARLRLFVQLAEETQLLSGDGTGANLTGILNASGLQTQAVGADPVPDAIMKAMTLIQVNAKFQASGIVMHPNDWQEVRLLKTADGVYIWGSPADEGPMRMWGLPVVPSEALSEGTAVVGAFNVASQIFRRSGITMAASNSHSTFFTENKLAILAEERLALAHYRGAAYCQVTGV